MPEDITFRQTLVGRCGEAGRLIAARDWSATSIGPIESWPQSLKSTLGLILLSPAPLVMLWGEEGIMLYNDAYSVFAGRRHPELLGSKVREGWPEVADFNDHVMKVGLAGGTLAYRDQELTLSRHGKPEQVWMNLDYSPVLDESGRPAGVVAVVAETTERVLADRRAASANETLEQRVAERTEELTVAHEALRQAQKMEAVGQLTGGIAHDFNNLLMGIGGSLEFIERGLARNGVEGLERYLQGAQSSTRRAAALTQRLLAFSRRQTLDPKPTDVNRLIFGMEDLIRRTAGPSIEVEVVGQAGLWPARVDAAQLESALLNLAINARDAMPAGGGITIETANKWLDERGGKEQELTPGQYLSLCVSDTGAGIPKEIAERIFDPFFTTKPIGEGTGLGLSMVHGFVRQSGGQVRVYSEIGKGTTMCIYLPRYMGDVAPETLEETVVPELGAGETVLVVDDEPTVRMLMADVLSEAGYSVIEAQDGPSAMRVLQSERRIELLLLAPIVLPLDGADDVVGKDQSSRQVHRLHAVAPDHVVLLGVVARDHH